jgi:hypothetical protein
MIAGENDKDKPGIYNNIHKVKEAGTGSHPGFFKISHEQYFYTA